MISHITIKNFRSILDLDTDLSEVTAIIGPNQAGKTNVLRALDWVLMNSAPAYERILAARATDNEVSVSITCDNGWRIERKRTPSTNLYLLFDPQAPDNPISLDKVGASLAQDVVRVTGIHPWTIGSTTINLHRQDVGSRTILDLSGPEFAVLLGFLSGSDLIESAIRTAGRLTTRAKTSAAAAEKSLADAEESVEALRSVVDLRPLTEEWRGVRAAVFNDSIPLRKLTEEVYALAEELAVDIPSEDELLGLKDLVSSGLDLHKEASELRKELFSLQQGVERLQFSQENLKKTESSVEEARESLHSLLEEVGTCPLCGRALS